MGIEPHLENRPLSVRRIRDLHHHKDKTRVYSTRERRGREKTRKRDGDKERGREKGKKKTRREKEVRSEKTRREGLRQRWGGPQASSRVGERTGPCPSEGLN